MPRITALVAVTAAVTALAIPIFLTGCAASTADTERTLAAAGFQMKFAKTPEQIQKAEAMPQRSLTPVPGPNGENLFVYADGKYCKCLYVGTEKAYDRYQKLALSNRIAENEEAASMNWGAWGAWGPWY